MKKKNPPTSIFSRSAIVAKAGLSIVAREVGGRAMAKIKEVRQTEQARIFTEALSQLKGSAMKFGQILSLEAQDILPPEALEALAKLQKNAEPVDAAVLFNLAEKELGHEKFAKLNLNREAIASASIGQVYRGRLDLSEVAVKIQFETVREGIRSDVRILKNVASLASIAFGKSIDFTEIAEEIETVLLNETDYVREVKLLQKYSEMLSGDERFLVPKPYLDFCTNKVLTMSFEEGMHLRDWIMQAPPMADRLKVGTTLLDLFITEFFKFGFVQTDPNMANFLIKPKTLQVVVLDFGAVLSYSESFIGDYKQLIQVLLSAPEAQLLSYAEERGFLDSRETIEIKRLFVQMLRASIEPFLDELQPFNFSNRDYSARVRQAVIEFTKQAKYSKPPREFIFLHRKLGGVFHILKMMELKIDLRPFWLKALS